MQGYSFQDPVYEVPALTQPAVKHRRAQSIINPKADSPLCACCSLPVQGQKYQFCKEDISVLQSYGPGVPLFFQFLMHSTILMAICMLTAGAFELISCATNNACQKGFCGNSVLLKLSIANLLDRPNLLNFIGYVNLFIVLLIIFYLQYVRLQARRYKVTHDTRRLTPSRYSLLLQNIPLGWSQMGILKQFDRWYFKLRHEDSLCMMVTCSYALEQYLSLLQQKKHLIIELAKQRALQKIEEIQKLIQQLTALNSDIQAVTTYLPKNGTFAIATFGSCQQRDLALYSFSSSFFGIKVSKAPEPEQIKWINCQYAPLNRTLRKGLILVIVLGLIGLSIYISYLLQIQQQKAILNGSKQLTTLITISFGTVLAISNITINFIIVLITQLQKPINQSAFLSSVSSKMVIAQISNSLISLAVQKLVVSKDNMFNAGGLIEDGTSAVLTNAILDLFLTAISIPGLAKKLMRKLQVNKLAKNKSFITQKQLNELYQPVEFQFSTGYSSVIYSLWLTALLGTFSPIVYIVTFLALLVKYPLLKYLFFAKFKRPKQLSQYLNDDMLDFNQIFPFLLSFGCFFFYFRQSGYQFRSVPLTNLIPSLIGMVLSGIYYLVPWSRVNKYLFKVQNEDPQQSYIQAYKDFYTDYQRVNPIYKTKVGSQKKRKQFPSSDQVVGKLLQLQELTKRPLIN